MILNITVTKSGANYPIVTVNGYSISNDTISVELINKLFDTDMRDAGAFLYKSGSVRVDDTRAEVDFGNQFHFSPESTGEEIAQEIVRRLMIVKRAVSLARSVSYTYNKTVII